MKKAYDMGRIGKARRSESGNSFDDKANANSSEGFPRGQNMAGCTLPN